MVCTLIVVTIGCTIWLRRSLQMELRYAASLTSDSRVLVVGSSHLFGTRSMRAGQPAANLSHRANSLEMIESQVRYAIDRTPSIDTVIFEVGHLVAGANPMHIRDHGFREPGVPSRKFPGTRLGKVRHTVDAFPPLRVPRLTPETVLKRMHPELGLEAEGFKVEKIATYTDNAAYRIYSINSVLNDENMDQIDENMAAMSRLITDLKQRDMKVVILVTPHDRLFRDQITDDQQTLLERFLAKAKVAGVDEILDHYADESLSERKWLTDADHLNDVGQKRFSQIIARELGWSQ